MVAAVFTHFAAADDESHRLRITRYQHATFLGCRVGTARESFPGRLHAANSGALLRLPETRDDMARLGLALYGYPMVDTQVPFRTAMTMLAEVTQVKQISEGDTVSYGRTWTAARTTRVATLPVGYADGIHRWRAGTDTVLIGGKRSPIIGRVTMDQIMVDVTDCDVVCKGDVAALLGDLDGNHLGADGIAVAGNTIPHEVLSNLVARGARPAALSPLDSVRAHRPIGDGSSAIARRGRSSRTDPARRLPQRPPLITAIERYLAQHNENRQPFKWTQTAERILTKVRRGRVSRNNHQSRLRQTTS